MGSPGTYSEPHKASHQVHSVYFLRGSAKEARVAHLRSLHQKYPTDRFKVLGEVGPSSGDSAEIIREYQRFWREWLPTADLEGRQLNKDFIWLVDEDFAFKRLTIRKRLSLRLNG